MCLVEQRTPPPYFQNKMKISGEGLFLLYYMSPAVKSPAGSGLLEGLGIEKKLFNLFQKKGEGFRARQAQ